MLAHSFDRFYVITKCILPTIEDLKFSKLKFYNNCEYLKEKNKHHNNEEVEQHILDLLRYCNKIKPHVSSFFFSKTKLNLSMKQYITFWKVK